MVVTEYRDADDAVLDDLTVRIVRFREAADTRRVLVGHLRDVEFDSGRVGLAALVDQVGFIAVAPHRYRARTLLARSPALSQRCVEAQAVLPARTQTPRGDDESTRSTETST